MKTVKYKKSKNVDPIKELVDGNWIDLRVPKDIFLKPGQSTVINLEYAFDMPKGIEAIVLPRSSTYKNYSITLLNSMAVMDDTYKGDSDYWRAIVKADKQCIIKANDRVFQFRFQPKMNANWWTKLSFIFTKYRFKEVEHLGNSDRGGIGKTGIN